MILAHVPADATRSEINRALALAIAFRDCGQPEKAEPWAAELLATLDAAALNLADGTHFLDTASPPKR